jgi:hypothetical protein
MDNQNSLSNSILQPNETTFFPSSSSSGESSFFDNLKSINLTTWLIIILILAFLGFNIFVYLAKGTQDITNFFAPLLQKIFGTTFLVTSKTIDVAAEGAKAVVGETAGAINAGLTTVQNVTSPSSVNSHPLNNHDDATINNSLSDALNSPHENETANHDYQATESSSSLKSGWCYIGEDRGFRSCSQINANDQCMSGDIFPSQELCINPSLRA